MPDARGRTLAPLLKTDQSQVIDIPLSAERMPGIISQVDGPRRPFPIFIYGKLSFKILLLFILSL